MEGVAATGNVANLGVVYKKEFDYTGPTSLQGRTLGVSNLFSNL